MRGSTALVCCLLGICFAAAAPAATVWTGPDTTFFRSNNVNNIDMLTPSVHLTRGAIQSIFNVAAEPGFDTINFDSPADTAWAFADLNGNPNDAGFDAANFANLNFAPFIVALGGPGPANGGGPGSGIPNMVLNRPGVLHLISDDIYLNIEFSIWNPGGVLGDAAIQYSRATVPVPAALPLFGSALGLLAWRRRRTA